MPTRNVNLTDHQDRFVTNALASGRYQNASEVVRDSLRLLEARDKEDGARLASLTSAIAEGEGALARGEYEDVALADLDDWLSRLALTA